MRKENSSPNPFSSFSQKILKRVPAGHPEHEAMAALLQKIRRQTDQLEESRSNAENQLQVETERDRYRTEAETERVRETQRQTQPQREMQQRETEAETEDR